MTAVARAHAAPRHSDTSTTPLSSPRQVAKKPAPYFRFFPVDFNAQTRNLRVTDVGVYILLLVDMHLRGEPVRSDIKRLAHKCRTTPKAMEAAVNTLLDEGLVVLKNGGLWSPLMDDEIAYRKKTSEVRSKIARERWEKTQQNQYEADAKAYIDSDVQSLRGLDGGPEGPPVSNGRFSTLDVDRRTEGARLNGAPSNASTEESDDDENLNCPF